MSLPPASPPDSAYVEVERLVRKFTALSGPARKAFNEDNTRKDFILPLFRALEWNTDSSAEVSAEEKVSRGWVDFSFRLVRTRCSLRFPPRYNLSRVFR